MFSQALCQRMIVTGHQREHTFSRVLTTEIRRSVRVQGPPGSVALIVLYGTWVLAIPSA